jgi:DNA adenine methylase
MEHYSTQTGYLKCIMAYKGGKSKELKTIQDFIPPLDTIETYVEPFIGGGSTFYALEYQNSVIADFNVDTYSLYWTLKNDFDWFYDRVELIDSKIRKYSATEPERIKRFFDKLITKFNTDNKKMTKRTRALHWFIINKMFFGSAGCKYKDGQITNTSLNGRKSLGVSELLKNKERYGKLLATTDIRNCSFIDVFNDPTVNKEGSFIFIDPPYFPTQQFKVKPESLYNCKFGIDEHKQLAECIRKSPAKCLCIVGDCINSQVIYRDLIKKTYSTTYSSSKTTTTQLVITNYDINTGK